MDEAEETAGERALREEREAEEGYSSPPEGTELAAEPGGDSSSTEILREVEHAARLVVENASGAEPGIDALREALGRLDAYEAGGR